MKINFYLRKTVLLLIAIVTCVNVSAANINFIFKEADVAMWKKFMQQPSAIEGKCNLEVLGINTKQVKFDWEDPNTWAREDGKVFHEGSTDGFATTVWGVSFSASAPFDGGTARVGWSRRAFIEGKGVGNGEVVFETGKSCDEKWIPYTPGLENLAGKFELITFAGVVNCQDTQIDSIRLTMNEPNKDCYLQFSRNKNLKQIDLSNSKAKIRQMASYRNNLSTLDAFVFENMRPDEKGADGKYTYRLLDWLQNIDENNFRLSTMPLLRDGRTISGYKKQKPFIPEGCKIGADGKTVEMKAGLFINLSSEATVRGQATTFVWKTNDGTVVTPDKGISGRFQFKDTFIDKFLICELTNSFFPGWICKTQPIKIVAEYSSGINPIKNDEISIFPNPVENEIMIKGGEALSATIFTLQGAEVMRSEVENNSINVSSLPKGYYLIQIAMSEGTVMKKMLKK